jgi:hypothetical protein
MLSPDDARQFGQRGQMLFFGRKNLHSGRGFSAHNLGSLNRLLNSPVKTDV